MTANELQNLVRQLSNSCWVRYWLHYSYPSRAPWLMAIECLDEANASPKMPDLIELGFTYEPRNFYKSKRGLHVIERTGDLDGLMP